MPSDLTCRSQATCFGGSVEFYSHVSQVCAGEMRFAVYRPPQAQQKPVPVVYFLSGLTCTEENFMIKAGAQRYAAEYGLMLVAPDTSPRNTGIPDEGADWDFGAGAGFYLDATVSPWSSHYRMYSYVVEELPALMAAHFPIRGDRQGICGHSMGGHGALVCGLRNPDRFRSLSAFAPIAAPMQCPWGQQALTGYLGADSEAWKLYDASELVKTLAGDRPILIDQGSADSFLETQLMPEVFVQACQKSGQPVIFNLRHGYDHSYYFIASFMGDHLRHHAELLAIA